MSRSQAFCLTLARVLLTEHAGPAVAEADLKAAALTSGQLVLDDAELIGHLRRSCGRHSWNAARIAPGLCACLQQHSAQLESRNSRGDLPVHRRQA
jgi:hypothetical protein